MKPVIFIIALFLSANFSRAQNQVSLRLSLIEQVAEGTCYEIAIRDKNNRMVTLAGQNYRLYYDTHNLHFRPDLTKITLDQEAYSNPDIQYSEKNGLGLLSISIDANQKIHQSLELGQNWAKTVQVCFDGQQQKSEDLIWADPDMTQQLASAELVLTEWTEDNHQLVLGIDELFRLNEEEVNRIISSEVTIYPNPTSDQFEYFFESETTQPEQLILQDILGRVVLKQDLPIGSNAGSMNISHLPDGPYFVKVTDLGLIQVIKSK